MEINTTIRPRPQATSRNLKIEAEGDAWKRQVKPKIRLVGRWLEQAGFRPGDRVQVVCLASGVIELRSTVAYTVSQTVSPGQRQ